MSGLETELRRKKQAEDAKAKARQAMKHEAQQAAEQDSRLEHYVEQEKAGLKKGAKLAEVNRTLRES